MAYVGYRQLRQTPGTLSEVNPIDSLAPATNDTTEMAHKRLANERRAAEAAAAKRVVDSTIRAKIKEEKEKGEDSIEDLTPDTSVKPVEF